MGVFFHDREHLGSQNEKIDGLHPQTYQRRLDITIQFLQVSIPRGWVNHHPRLHPSSVIVIPLVDHYMISHDIPISDVSNP